MRVRAACCSLPLLLLLPLEQAVAKYMGSYSALVGGDGAWAMQLLLGPPAVVGYTRLHADGAAASKKPPAWRKETLCDVTRDGEARWSYSEGVFGSKTLSDDELFALLAQVRRAREPPAPSRPLLTPLLTCTRSLRCSRSRTSAIA